MTLFYWGDFKIKTAVMSTNMFKHTRGRDPGYGGGGSKSMPFVVPSPDAGSRDS